MEQLPEVVWWKRLTAAFSALVFTLVLTTVLLTLQDLWREPNLHWLNGGELQITAFLLFVGGIDLVVAYVFFAIPLVLLWPFPSQLKHWYAMLGISMMWPPLMNIIIFWHSGPLNVLKEMRRLPMAQVLSVIPAFCACCIYLLLVRRQVKRLHLRS